MTDKGLADGRSAAGFALAAAGAALGTAYVAEYGFGLLPCELCLWQRLPYWAVIAAAGAALLLPRFALPLVALAILLLALGALLGGYHAGVEWGFWPNVLARCTPPPGPPARSVDDLMRALAAAPIIRCDEPAIRVLGLSMAGWNALYGTAAAAITALLFRRARAPR